MQDTKPWDRLGSWAGIPMMLKWKNAYLESRKYSVYIDLEDVGEWTNQEQNSMILYVWNLCKQGLAGGELVLAMFYW